MRRSTELQSTTGVHVQIPKDGIVGYAVARRQMRTQHTIITVVFTSSLSSGVNEHTECLDLQDWAWRVAEVVVACPLGRPEEYAVLPFDCRAVYGSLQSLWDIQQTMRRDAGCLEFTVVWQQMHQPVYSLRL